MARDTAQKMDPNVRTLLAQLDLSDGVGTALRLLADELDRLEKLREDLDSKIEKMGFARDILNNLMSKDGGDDDFDVFENPMYLHRKRRTDKKQFRVNQTAEVISRSREILLMEGRPLDRMELLARISASGFQISTTNPPKFIGRTLWESAEFVHIKNEGYWLANEAKTWKTTG